MSYDNWKLASPEDSDGPWDRPEEEAESDNDLPDTAGVTCRGCDHFILDASDEDAHKHQGWFWCDTCYYDLPEIVEGLQEAAHAAVVRDER